MGCSASRSHPFLTDNHLLSLPLEEDQKPISNPNPNFPNFSPNSRALSLPTPLIHHPPLRKGDTNHLVSLTSTTYGSLVLVDSVPDTNPNFSPHRDFPAKKQNPSYRGSSDIPVKSVGVKEVSLSPDTVINTWELMEGLEDDEFDFDIIQKPSFGFPNGETKPNSSFSSDSDGLLEKSYLIVEKPESRVENPETKPLWKHLSEEKLLAKLDPNVGLGYRKALSSKQLGVRYTDQRISQSLSFGAKSKNVSSTDELVLPGTEDRIVVYHTSLRGIRRTYEDCCAVRMIFRGLRVYVDDRDISMDSSYKKELQSALKGKPLSLPRVFIRGKYIGGADEIKQLNECGELARLLEGFPVKDLSDVCESCGDARFYPCLNCNGSRKIFEEDEDTLRRCPDCNENGLIRCPNCCT